MSADRLDHLAHSRGLGEAYYDYRGELRYFSRETRKAILSAMGCAVDDPAAVDREIAAADRERWRAGVPAVTVLRPDERRVPIVVALDAANRHLHWTLTLDGGYCEDQQNPMKLSRVHDFSAKPKSCKSCPPPRPVKDKPAPAEELPPMEKTPAPKWEPAPPSQG